jgi:uncharacterized protein
MTRYLRGAMAIIALILPTLSLAALGVIWLWQNNLLIVWSLAASAVALVIYGFERWLVSRGQRQPVRGSVDGEDRARAEISNAETAPPPLLVTEREQQATRAIERLAETIDTKDLTSRKAMQDLAMSAVETVARNMHPEEKKPLWKFTVPEALVLIEQVSLRMNRFVMNNVPLGDRLTVGQLLAIYRWRSAIGVAEKAYDLWRILRLANPVTAISGEVREKLSGQLIKGLQTEFTRTLAQRYVLEIGRAAIDLYSGRLRPDLNSFADDGDIVLPPERDPLRYFVIGQSGAGKATLINRLVGDIQADAGVLPADERFTVHNLKLAGGPQIELVDTPGLEAEGKLRRSIFDLLETADAILLVVSAVRPDRLVDEAALDELRERFALERSRISPPVVVVMTNIDRLRPIDEWNPPYDIAEPRTEKAQSIRQALEAIAEDLGVSDAEVVPVAIPSVSNSYNIDVLQVRILDVAAHAISAQISRLATKASQSRPRWGTIWKQALNAGRIIGSSVWSSKRAPSDDAG